MPARMHTLLWKPSLGAVKGSCRFIFPTGRLWQLPLLCIVESVCVCVCEGVTNGAYSHLPARAKGQVSCYDSLLSLAFFIICFSLVRNVAPQKVEAENNGGLWAVQTCVCVCVCFNADIWPQTHNCTHMNSLTDVLIWTFERFRGLAHTQTHTLFDWW